MKWSPDFIGIGAEKSATTWAWKILNEHPSIRMSQPKELNFFNDNTDRGMDWYRRHFRYGAGSQKCGEISPLYMDNPKVAGRIAEQCPNVRLLIMLRNPFERAMSHLCHDAHRLLGGVSHATPYNLQKLARGDDKYLRRSLYGRSLQPFFDHFPVEQLGVFYFDSLRHDSAQLKNDLYEFVRVDTDFVPLFLHERVNESTDWFSPKLARWAMGTSRTAKSFPPTRVLMEWLCRHTQLRERTIQILSVKRGRPQIDFCDVFTSAERDVVLQDLEHLRTLIPVGLPNSWSVPTPKNRQSFSPSVQPFAA